MMWHAERRGNLGRAAAVAMLISLSWLARAASPAPPDATVMEPPSPTDQQLADDSVTHFIQHHVTTNASTSGSGTAGPIRWRGGRPGTICVLTRGLQPQLDDYVSARLRAIATYVSAPVSDDPGCVDNVRILFTREPGTAMATMLKAAARLQGIGYPHQMDQELKISAAHAIQGWYVTGPGGQAVQNVDATLLGGLSLHSLWPRVIPTGTFANGGRGRGMVSIFVAIDAAKVKAYSLEAIADYVSMAALAVVQAPDYCDPLPSILDLMSSTCGGRDKPSGITAGDLAFLKAVYEHDTGLGRVRTHEEIRRAMLQQFGR